MNKPIPRVNLHPASIKYLKLGHPWITEDSYTKKFPKEAPLLLGVDEKTKKETALLIADPQHKSVKARLWSLSPDDFKPGFNLLESMRERITTALNKRLSAQLFSERENIILINGESDQLPGLIVQLLKSEIILQYYALYWKSFESELIDCLKTQLKTMSSTLEIKDFWIQERTFDQEKSIRSVSGRDSGELVLREFGVNYKIRINRHYDFGIYTDMSAIRKSMLPFIKEKNNVLNLFSYTGAFSLFALKNKCSHVVSVDLSSKYLSWLEENLSLNPDLSPAQNQNMCMPCEKALDKLHSDNRRFDVIICDPPSASSDGQKMSSALKSYEVLLPKMLELLEKNGSLFVFLNTHTISWNKFEEKLRQIIEASVFNNKLIVGKRFKLSEDCLPLKGFHEGDYLKGFLIEYKNKGS